MAYMANSNMADTADNYLKLHQNAQCMNTLIYFERLLHEDFKNIVNAHEECLETCLLDAFLTKKFPL